ncbi:hypothetical protein BCR43DRAFT_319158 [Syncephalastrum racemosum]|uniref:RSE1/DDB1/CPSF1 first beta-propeller domain-containing protein n=1 Tax=Syncephalastrum racemosum TaxID=13706 RepID=A0A1X2H760_SYNRA|nr:hypothetical protein BCR43DRAFT_319158 [Syncephalastrum racemosum]
MSNMSVYYRSTLYGTAVQRIVSGAFAGPRQCNVCLFKGHSIEFMQLVTSPRDPFVSRFEQPVFGTIYDAQRLTCQFNNDDHPPAINSRQGEIEEELYCQNTRPHTPVSGDDVLVMLSEYNKLVFSTVVGHDLERLGRFETLVEVPLDEPGPEYTKMGRKLAVDPCSRALATASYRDRIDVFILHDTMSRAYFHPISGMGSIVEDGIIWHMEFLHTTSESKDRILLATVVFK